MTYTATQALIGQTNLWNNSTDVQVLPAGVFLLPGAADSQALLAEIARIAIAAPFRHMTVGSGKRMSVAMTNCGNWGWTSGAGGYRYTRQDPLSGALRTPWPAMPSAFKQLASRCALRCGFAGFKPDACLINRYTGSAHMGLHQDKDERDFSQPIVSVSIGASAIFLLGGNLRQDKTQAITLSDGDVLVWGNVARLYFHAVRAPTADDSASTSGEAPERMNLTFRKAR